jgi:hypothetical protein
MVHIDQIIGLDTYLKGNAILTGPTAPRFIAHAFLFSLPLKYYVLSTAIVNFDT